MLVNSDWSNKIMNKLYVHDIIVPVLGITGFRKEVTVWARAAK